MSEARALVRLGVDEVGVGTPRDQGASRRDLIGDTLAEEHNELAKPMALSVTDRRTPRAAVFVHGLMETEFSWGGRPNCGSRLAEEAGWTPVCRSTWPAPATSPCSTTGRCTRACASGCLDG